MCPPCVDAIRLVEVRSSQARGEPDGRLLRGGSFVLLRARCAWHVGAGRMGPHCCRAYEPADVRLTADGHVEIRVGTHSHGQGHETSFAQIAHEILGVDFDKIKVIQGDTSYTPYSTGTWGSRSIVLGGGAVVRAARLVAARAASIGAWLLQKDPRTLPSPTDASSRRMAAA